MKQRVTTRGKATKGPKRKAAKSGSAPPITRRRRSADVGLQEQLDEARRELHEAREQQTATSEVLKVISSSPGDLEPVFRSILENATVICHATFGSLQLYEGDYTFRTVGVHGAVEGYAEQRKREPVIRRGPGTLIGEVVETRHYVHITDLAEKPEMAPALAKIDGARTLLIVPMLKEQKLLGIVNVYRHFVRPFTDKQIVLATILPTKPSSPSRIPGCLASYASVQMT